MRILIVEDEMDLCDSIAEGLQMEGYAVDTCYDGNEAYELIMTETLLPLTKKELAILEYFLLNPNKVISQEEMIEHVWNMEADCFSNAVRVHIASLRKKLKTALTYDLIETKIGEGYYLSGGDK